MDSIEPYKAPQISTAAEQLFWSGIKDLKILLDDPDVTEIAINGDEPFVFTSGVGGRKKHDIHISQSRVKAAISALASLNSKDTTKKKDAIISQKLGDLRVTGVLAPVSYKGHLLRIRKHTSSDMSLEDMVRGGSFTDAQKDYLIGIVVQSSNYLVSGGTASGKSQPLDSLVLTPSGYRKMRDVNVGDFVITPTGEHSIITGTFPQGEKDIYKITFDDGRSAESCDEHLWKLWSRVSVWSKTKKKKVRGMGWRVVPLKEAIRWINNSKKMIDRLAVPLVQACSIEGLYKEVKFSPYVIACLVGDGGLTDKRNIRFSSADPFIIEKISNLLPEFIVKKVKGDNYDYRISSTTKFAINKLTDELILMGLMGKYSHEKFIPKIYKYGSLEQRTEFVQGLIDTDGYVSKCGSISFCTTSQKLIKDLQEVIWSLGGIAVITEVVKKFKYKSAVLKNGKLAYCMTISMPLEGKHKIVSLPRKVERLREESKTRRLLIKKIEYVGKKESQCISIEDKQGLYITNDYVITHNTTALNAMIAHIPKNESVVTIESGIELKVKVIDNTRLLEFPEHDIGSDTLLQTCLRLTPDRIIVGELRKPIEAATFLEVMGAGHDGCSATIHANSAKLTLMRFDSLVASHAQDSVLSIRSRTASVLEYVIHFKKDKATHKRTLTGIVKICGLDARGEYILEDII